MAIASSSSSSSSQHKYHVFISFRGEDTRSNFTSHLYDALCGKKIKVYIDEESLKKGDEISPALMRAIQESLISVVILSENYASSSWCLDELNHILQCKETNKQIVVPVFYGVSPSQVEKQQGSYGSAFAKHEDRFKDQMDKVQHWRDSLTKVANLEGWNSSDIGSSSKLVEAILKDILEKLHHMLPYDTDFKDLVGIEKRIQHIESLLNIDSLDVHIVGIWGMGGIGKTTLARVIFNRFASQFESFYFLENVKKESERGLTNLQKELFSKILLEENGNLHMVGQIVKERLRRTKVLIVLDDVDNVEQYEYLVKGRDRFGDGSKIIVTTRDKQVLNNIEVDETYEVEELDFFESQDLFCSKAFPRSTPTTDYRNLFGRVVQYSGGIPLALKVLGSHLQSKSTKEWESELDKLETIPNNKVHNVLKISYDGLDSNEKEIFLDIACFFNGENEYFVKRLLDAYGNRFMDSGIRVLVDKTLITTRLNSTLEMHNLLKEMGRKIVCDESIEPGKRSRLWLAQDIFHVLKYKTGTEVVQGMSMSMCQLCKNKDVIHLDPLVFKGMHNLKYINFKNGFQVPNFYDFPDGLEFLPDVLRYICWDCYPLKSLPSDFTPRNLVELHLLDSKLQHLWNNGVPILEKLKVLNLSYSKNLIQIQDLSLAVNLENIYLEECSSLKSLPDLSLCANLKEIDLLYCSSLESLPNLSPCVNLENIYLSKCSSLESLPDLFFCENLKRIDFSYCSSLKSLSYLSLPTDLEEIDLSYCSSLESLPDLSFCENLKRIDLSYCSSLKSLPYDISLPTDLEEIYLSHCSSLVSLPDLSLCANLKKIDLLYCSSLESLPNLSPCVNLENIYLLKCSSFKSLPDLFFCENMKRIDFSYCSSLKSLSYLYFSIELEEIDLSYCSSLKCLPSLSFCKNLKRIDLSYCSSLESLPDLSLCKNLKRIDLSYCSRLKSLSYFFLPTILEEMCLSYCSSLESLPNIFCCSNLKKIDLSYCSSFKSLSNLPLPMNLEEINLSYCISLKSLSDLTISVKFERIFLEYCYSLENLSNIPVNIKVLNLSGTTIEEIPRSIEFLSHLKCLELRKCKRLKRLPITICKLKYLERLYLEDCSELDYLPDFLEPMECLKELYLTGSGIRELPFSIYNLIQIGELDLTDCKNLPSVPHSIGRMRIEKLNLSGCGNLENFSFLKSLPPSLRDLNLSDTCLSEIPDYIFSLPQLGSLSVAGTMISTFPESIKSSKNLRYLNMRCCKSLRILPELSLCIGRVDASACTSIEKFSKTSIDAFKKDPRVNRRSLYFLDCLKLDYRCIITEFQTRALGLAFLEKDYDYYRPHNPSISDIFYDFEVFACYTGDEIPQWFNYQNNDGSRVNVKLSPHDLNFMDHFATSIVARGDADEWTTFTLQCDICIRTNEGERHLKLKGEFYKYENNHISNHMHMWDVKKYNIDFSSAKEISFDFKVCESVSLNPMLECKVEKCGIRLHLLQDAAENDIISRKFVDEESNNVTYEQLQTSGFGIIDCDINDERPPKRTKFDFL